MANGANQKMFPSSGQRPPLPGQPLRRGPLPPPKRDSRLRTGLLVAGIVVALVFIFILIIAAAGAGGENVLFRAIGLEGDIRGILSRVVNIVFGIADTIALIALVIGGFVYMVAMGDPRELHRARRILLISVISLIGISFLWGTLILMLQFRSEDGTQIQQGGTQIITNPSPAEGSAPFTVGFDVTGVPEQNYFFSWDFGDGSSGTGKTVQHTYRREGFFEPSVTITDVQARTTLVKTKVFVSNTKPSAEFEAEPLQGRAPLSVKFDASGSEDPNGNIIKYEWDFGDSDITSDNPNSAEGVLATHIYNQNGSYTVTLVVTDNNFETQVATQTIGVGEAPDIPLAKISTTPPLDETTTPNSIVGTPPFRVNFSGAKSRDIDGEIVKYDWDFGDGSASESSQTANHIFEELGSYAVTLTVTDNDNNTDAMTVDIIVRPPGKPPIAVIKSDPPPNVQGEIIKDVPVTVNLDGIDSTDEDGNIVLYEWNFGDNSPIQTGQTVSYTYNDPGTFTILLTVTDDGGNKSVKPAQLVVKATSPGPEKPIAKIVTDPPTASGNIPFTVKFDGSSSFDNDGSIISYEWDFGDGNVILGGAQVTHVYQSAGIYTVKLTVHDNDGLTGSTSIPVAAHIPAPVAKITTNKTSGPAPLTISFDASGSTGNITTYSWNFGDSTVESGRRIDHTYNTAGSYTVTLTVQDTAGQVDTETVTITVQ